MFLAQRICNPQSPIPNPCSDHGKSSSRNRAGHGSAASRHAGGDWSVAVGAGACGPGGCRRAVDRRRRPVHGAQRRGRAAAALQGGPAGRLPAGSWRPYKEKHGVWVVHGTYRGTCPDLRPAHGLHPPGLHHDLAGRPAAVPVPVPRQRVRPPGDQLRGPAPRPLERCAIRVAEDGQLEVDRSRVFREELGQWADPASFVPG